MKLYARISDSAVPRYTEATELDVYRAMLLLLLERPSTFAVQCKVRDWIELLEREERDEDDDNERFAQYARG